MRIGGTTELASRSPDWGWRKVVQRPVTIGGIAVGVGVGGGVLAATAPPWVGLGALGGTVVVWAMLRSLRVGLAVVIAIATLLPFGTLPLKAAFTPSLLELALAGLMAVWLVRVLGQPEYPVRFSFLGGSMLALLALTVFALVLGAGGLPDNLTLHNYLKFALAVAFFFSVINVLRNEDDLRSMARTLIVTATLAAVVGIALRQINTTTALRLLETLGRVGYPTSGRVLRFIEDDPARAERAIGTSVDPNSFGGMLALCGAFTICQLWARRPVLARPAVMVSSGLLVVCTLLTQSRGALYGLFAALAFVATVRDRRLWWGLCGVVVLVGADLAAGTGVVGHVIDTRRFVQGVQFQDQAQQMRLAEYRNALEIIKRYPVFGVGFGSGPELGLITGVSSIYLAIGERIGLVGLALFLLTIGVFFVRAAQSWRVLPTVRQDMLLSAMAAIVAALVVGLADHYFFNIEFAHMVALFWGTVALGVAAVECTAPGDEVVSGGQVARSRK
ncbi:MAG: O-antigen ligase family protein [Herpetosiphon sp.]